MREKEAKRGSFFEYSQHRNHMKREGPGKQVVVRKSGKGFAGGLSLICFSTCYAEVIVIYKFNKNVGSWDNVVAKVNAC